MSAQVPGIDALLLGHSHQIFPKPASTVGQFAAARVRWLDRHRRRIAVVLGWVVAFGVFPMISPHWPRAYAYAVCIGAGVVLWSLTEIALAWFTAVWETECDQLTTDRGLPRAIVRK